MEIKADEARLKHVMEPDDFSLVLGGPLYQLFRRAQLSDSVLGHLRKRILFISLFTWLPLLILSVMEGTAIGNVKVPFLMDIEAHARYLLALPLLIAAELIVNERLRSVLRNFLNRKLIPEDSRGRAEAALFSAFRLRNSVIAELILILVVYTFVVVVWGRHFVMHTATWYASVGDDGKLKPTLCGLWYGYISIPIFQFILMRWYFRLFIWARFLWQLSRIKLDLVPTHPDNVGGLGFLANTVYAFAPILAAHGVLLSSMIANRIFYMGAKLPDFKIEICAMLLLVLAIVLCPLLVFMPQLSRAKRKGLTEYGTLAMRYVREFDQKWLRDGAGSDEALIGSADIQSLADMGGSFDIIRGMRLIPFTTQALAQLAIITLLPLFPLLLTMFSLTQLIDRLVSTIL